MFLGGHHQGPRFSLLAHACASCYLMHVMHTRKHSRDDVAAAVATLASSGERPAIVWVVAGQRTRVYLYAGERVIAQVDDASGEAPYGKDRATWAAVEAGATFRITRSQNSAA